MSGTVTVTVPYWRTPGTIRRCVDSILAQTYRDLVCVVVNDGDGRTPPWPALSAIDDPRLIRFDVRRNRGRYYVDHVTAAAARTPWWLPHDADDWSDHDRLASLIAASGGGVDAVMTPFTKWPIGATSAERRAIKYPSHGGPLRTVAHLSSLWRTDVARLLTCPRWRIGYDAIMTSAVALHGAVTYLQEPSYHMVKRAGSLTTSRRTGTGTTYRRRQKRAQRAAWRRASVEGASLGEVALALRRAFPVPSAIAAQAERDIERLRSILEFPSILVDVYGRGEV